ncbi:hypothetical protein [Nocardia sp. NPDC003345]
MVVAGAVPVVVALVGNGTANADTGAVIPVSGTENADPAVFSTPAAEGVPGVAGAEAADTGEWPYAEAPNVRPYLGRHIPDDTLSSLQWARPVPAGEYLSPLEVLHAPGPVDPVPPIAPPPGALRFGDVQVQSPEWLPREHAVQINDGAALTEANFATFLDSVGMERTRSDRVAGQTLGAAALGAAAGAVASAPFAAIGAGVGGAIGFAVGVPFAPIGLAAVPVGAAYGAALMSVPLATIGAGIGAGLGAAHALSAPPRALAPAPDLGASLPGATQG